MDTATSFREQIQKSHIYEPPPPPSSLPHQPTSVPVSPPKPHCQPTTTPNHNNNSVSSPMDTNENLCSLDDVSSHSSDDAPPSSLPHQPTSVPISLPKPYCQPTTTPNHNNSVSSPMDTNENLCSHDDVSSYSNDEDDDDDYVSMQGAAVTYITTPATASMFPETIRHFKPTQQQILHPDIDTNNFRSSLLALSKRLFPKPWYKKQQDTLKPQRLAFLKEQRLIRQRWRKKKDARNYRNRQKSLTINFHKSLLHQIETPI